MAKLQVLVPLDGTEFSRQVLPQVRRLFGPEHYAVRLLHVARGPGAGPVPGPAVVGPDMTLYNYSSDLFLSDFPLQSPTAGSVRDGAGLERHAIYERQDLDELREGLERELGEEVALFRGEGYEVGVTVHFGNPVDEIIDFAEGERVDVVAMATHGRTGFGKFLLGSVAQDVFHRVGVPVLLVRVRDAQGTAESEDEAVQAPPMEEASLNDLPGLGRMTVLRSDEGNILEAKGTWRPADPQADLTSILQAYATGDHLLYQGLIDGAEPPPGSPDGPGAVRGRTEVFVSSIHEYETEAGGRQTVVNVQGRNILDEQTLVVESGDPSLGRRAQDDSRGRMP